ARPQKRWNGVDDGLEPDSLLAELFESIAQLLALRILDQITHVRSVYRAVRAMLTILNPGPKHKLFKERHRHQKASPWRSLNFVFISWGEVLWDFCKRHGGYVVFWLRR